MKKIIDKNIELYTQKGKEFSKKLNISVWQRGLSFLFSLVAFVALLSYNQTKLAVIVLVIGFILLGIFIKRFLKFQKLKNYYQILLQINQNEQKALNFDFSAFENGAEFIDAGHNYSFDMDIFGKNSLFQMLCRSISPLGKYKLSQSLKNISLDINNITAKQKAIAYLSDKVDWRQDFEAILRLNEVKKEKNYTFFASKDNHENSISTIFKTNFISKLELNHPVWKIALIALPTIALGSFIAAVLGYLPVQILIFYLVMMFGVVGLKAKYISSVHAQTAKLNKSIKSYAELVERIEELENVPQYIAQKQELLKTDNQKVSDALNELAHLIGKLDYRLNLAFIIFADAFLLWDLQIVQRIELWNNKHFQNIEKWIHTVAEFEELNSLANFKALNPEFSFPTLSKALQYKAQNLGHPSIAVDKRKTNNFEITDHTKSFIITGANMAGKSTFLRTLGVNLILAQSGSVVCASEMEISPMPLYTSIRINDSVSENESYFYAELKRLKYILESLTDEKPAMVILDEMLRGTNSADKHKGSEGFLRKMLTKNAITFIATHDVQLGSLEQEFKGKVKNHCFEAQIENDELFFDYQLRQGVSKNLNASFLMKKMEII